MEINRRSRDYDTGEITFAEGGYFLRPRKSLKRLEKSGQGDWKNRQR